MIVAAIMTMVGLLRTMMVVIIMMMIVSVILLGQKCGLHTINIELGLRLPEEPMQTVWMSSPAWGVRG